MKNSSLLNMLLLPLCLLSGLSESTATPANLLKHTVYKEEPVVDTTRKTQVTLHILLDLAQEINEEKVRTLLTHYYEKSMAREGFRHSKHPTNVYIYIYTTEAKARSGMGQWIGMIAKAHEPEGRIYLSEIQFQSLAQKPEVKSGLSEQERQRIWDAVIRAEDRVQNESYAIYPLEDVNTVMQDLKKAAVLERRLLAKYMDQIIEANQIDESTLSAIKLEGATKGWAFPVRDPAIP